MAIPTNARKTLQLAAASKKAGRFFLANIRQEVCVDKRSRDLFFREVGKITDKSSDACLRRTVDIVRKKRLTLKGRPIDNANFNILLRVIGLPHIEFTFDGYFAATGMSYKSFKSRFKRYRNSRRREEFVRRCFEGRSDPINLDSFIGAVWVADSDKIISPTSAAQTKTLIQRLALPVNILRDRAAIFIRYKRSILKRGHPRLPRAFDAVTGHCRVERKCDAPWGRTRPLIRGQKYLPEAVHHSVRLLPPNFAIEAQTWT